MKRTTIFAEEELLDELREIAEEKNRSVAETVREAITNYIRIHRKRKKNRPSFVGVGKSGRSDISERYEELLWKKNTK